MKVKENKGMSLIVFTIILAVLVVVAGGIIVYLLNNPVKEEVTIQNPSSIQSNMSNNEDVKERESVIENKKEENLVVINDDEKFNAEGKLSEYISEEENSIEVPIQISYIVNGTNKGKLEIKNNKKVVYSKITEKNIIEINRLRDAFDSDIFVLYEDGTVGKISISDIKNDKYDMVEVENCKNIVRIQELVFEYENAGGDYVLVAVDNNGKISTLAIYSI